MLFKKTRDIIVETATIVKGLKADFKGHVDDNKEDIEGLYVVIKECHGSCPEKDRFDDYIKAANGTLLRIEKKYDAAKIAAMDDKKIAATEKGQYMDKLTAITDEVKGMKQAKKTFRQVMADIGKILGCIILLAGFVFGIVRYYEVKKMRGDVKIEKLLKELIEEQRVG